MLWLSGAVVFYAARRRKSVQFAEQWRVQDEQVPGRKFGSG
jgi:hypothetical protein